MVGCEAGTDYDIIPFKGKPTIIRNKNGYFKIIDMVKPANIVRFTNNVVFKGEKFKFDPVTEKLEHEIDPAAASDKYEDIEYAYAYIKFADGFEKTVVMSKKDLDTIKKVSPSASTDYSPWKTMPVRMVKTKVTKELAKELLTLFSGKLTASMVSAINSDEQVVSDVDKQGHIANDDTIYTDAPYEDKEPKKVSLSEVE
jgi:recombinational DNA repair protein RecT